MDERLAVDFHYQIVLDGTSREYVGAVAVALVQRKKRAVVEAVKVVMNPPVPRPGDVSLKVRLEQAAEASIAVLVPIREVVPEQAAVAVELSPLAPDDGPGVNDPAVHVDEVFGVAECRREERVAGPGAGAVPNTDSTESVVDARRQRRGEFAVISRGIPSNFRL